METLPLGCDAVYRLPLTLPSLRIAWMIIPMPATEQDLDFLMEHLLEWRPALLANSDKEKVSEHGN